MALLYKPKSFETLGSVFDIILSFFNNRWSRMVLDRKPLPDILPKLELLLKMWNMDMQERIQLRLKEIFKNY